MGREKTRRGWLLATVISMLPVVGMASPAQALPAGFVEETVFSGLVNPTNIEFASDGRVFVAEKRGTIRVFDSLTDTTPELFADLSVNVHNYWDRGLLGLALHPDFPTTPEVYVLYTYDAEIGGTAPKWGTAGVYSDPCPSPPGATADGCVVSGRLSRLTASGNQMIGSEEVLIEDWCQQYPSHSIGDLAFGSDGMLYASAGDGASFNFVDYGQDGNPVNPCGDPPGGVGGSMTPATAEGGALRSQDLRTTGDPVTLDGAVIRIDPATGAAPADNPLVGSSDPNARRIVAYGLRNPFRIAFRPGTSDLWLGDVGWNNWEELNRIPSPTSGVLNFGWPCYEGGSGTSARQSGYDNANLDICENLYADAGAVTAPHFGYRHTEDITGSDDCRPADPPQGTSSSIAGVAFYPGGSFPDNYDGALFGADYSRDCIWVMFPDASGVPDPTTVEIIQPNAAGPVDLAIGPDGSVYYADLQGGRIQRIRYTAENEPPTASVTADHLSGDAPLTVNFDGSASTDPDGESLTYAWDLDGDGQFDDGSTAQVSFLYTDPGLYQASLRVTDPEGESDSDSVTINVSNTDPVVTIEIPSSEATWVVGDDIDFSGSAADTQDGDLSSELDWSLVLHHCADDGSCHQHTDIGSWMDTTTGSFTAPDHEYPSWLELTAAVTDSHGATATESVRLNPQTVDLTVASNPSGLDLSVGGTQAAAPFTATVIVGSSNTIGAPSPQQTSDGTYWIFASWSDGGAQSHLVTAGTTATTYTANFFAQRAPTASATASPDTGRAPLVVDFDASSSTDPEGGELTYVWNFGDGQLGSGSHVSHMYTSPGKYQATLVVTDSFQLSDSVSIPIQVKGGGNKGGTDATPTVMITSPSDGDTVIGSVTVTANATDDQSVASVEFKIDGVTLHTDTDGSDGWTASWDTTTATHESHTITAVATDTASQTASHSITVNVSDDGGTEPSTEYVYVSDLDGGTVNDGRNWSARVLVQVSNEQGQPVSGAVVSGTWSSGASGAALCTTDSDGWCFVTSPSIRKNLSSVTFTVENVSDDDRAYDPAYNTDPDGGSNGTRIVVVR